MFGQVPNLIVIGIAAALLCATPLLRGTPPPAAMHSMHSHDHDHDHGAASAGLHDHQHTVSMQMVFEYGYKTTLWCSSLQTDTPMSYMAVLLGLGLLAFLHEGLTVYRNARASSSGYSADQLDLLRESKLVAAAGGATSLERIIQAGLHVASLGLSYLLMLAVMSMNMGVFVGVLAGFGAGFYVYSGQQAALLVRGDACHGN